MKTLVLITTLWCSLSEAADVLLTENRAAVNRNNQFGIHRNWNSWKFGRVENDDDKAWWVDDAYEYGGVRLDQMHYSPGNTSMENVESSLANVAGRDRQIILFPYIHLFERHANYSTNPEYTGVPAYLLKHNVTNCKNFDYWMPDYNNPHLLTAIEETITAMGKAFDNDKRLFAVQIGFVGEDGLWKVDKPGTLEPKAKRCSDSYPTKATTERIINAFRTSFPNTWLIMPNPWYVDYNFTSAPEIGILDSDFGGQNYTAKVTSVGMQNRWKMAPIVSSFRKDVETCWFTKNPSSTCQDKGITTNISVINNEIKIRHPLTIRVNDAIELYKTDNDTLDRIRAVDTVLGFQTHLSQVSLQVSKGELRVCAVIENIGSSPFYAPPKRPLSMMLSMNDDTFVMNATDDPSHTNLARLLPGERETYLYRLPWKQLDECQTVGNLACQPHGQTCEDKDKSPYSRGDWYCKCGNRNFEERGRPAICSVDTKFQADPAKWYDKSEKTTIGDPTVVGVKGASYTIAFWTKIATCDVQKCTTDKTMYIWDTGVIVGSGEWAYNGHGLQIAYQGLKISFRNGDTCDSKVKPPLNEWVHVTFAHDITTKNLSIFFNSKLVNSCTVGQNNGTKPMVIAQFHKDENYFKGWLKDFRIIETSIPQNEIVKLYNHRAIEELPVSVKLQMKTTFQTRGPLTFASSHSNISEGILSLTIPQETNFRAEGCLLAEATAVPQTNTPTDAPTSPPAETDDCNKLQLTGFTATVRTSTGNVSSDCDGTYTSHPSHKYWIKDDNTRELWRHPFDTYRCTLMDVSKSDNPMSAPHFGFYSSDWWGGHLKCLEKRTPVPTVAPTPLPPGQTFSPPTPVPATSVPNWKVSSQAPSSPATQNPVGSTPSPAGTQTTVSPPLSTSLPNANVSRTDSPTTNQPEGAPSSGAAAGTKKDKKVPIWFYIMIPLVGVLVVISVSVWVKVYLKRKAENIPQSSKFGSFDAEHRFDAFESNPSSVQPVMPQSGIPETTFNGMGTVSAMHPINPGTIVL